MMAEFHSAVFCLSGNVYARSLSHCHDLLGHSNKTGPLLLLTLEQICEVGATAVFSSFCIPISKCSLNDILSVT